MESDNFRERALELREFINGYIAGRDAGLAPHTKAMLAFLDDFLVAEPAPGPSIDISILPVEITAQKLEGLSGVELEPLINLVTEVEQPTSGLACTEEVSDEAKVEAFLTARAATGRECGVVDATPAKKRRAWSPEARAAARERMRAMHAARATGRHSVQEPTEGPTAMETPPIIVKHSKSRTQTHVVESRKVSLARPEPLAVPPSPHRLAISHPDWAGKREDGQLHDSDWPDIRDMLAKGRSRRTIASDFDVEPETLDAFIAERQQAKEAASSAGEARAPLA